MFANKETTLCLYKQALHGICQDYVIKFNQEQNDIEGVIPLALDLVQEVVRNRQIEDKMVKGRLVAVVRYIREKDNDVVRTYHPSFQSETIYDVEEFFIRHMMKIAQRMEEFNNKGSNLCIKDIEEIHLHLTCTHGKL